MVRVCFDYMGEGDENEIDALYLHADHIVSYWNGWAVPAVTEAEFRRFIRAWLDNDPNGTWKTDGVTATPQVLSYQDTDRDEPDDFKAVGTDAAGDVLYGIDGWTWVAA